MKKRHIYAICILLTSWSCRTVEVTPVGGTLKMDGNEIRLARCFEKYLSKDVDGSKTYYHWDFIVAEDGISFENNVMKGKGTYLYFKVTAVNIADTLNIPVANYQYPVASGKHYFDHGAVITNFEYGKSSGVNENLGNVSLAICDVEKIELKYKITVVISRVGKEDIVMKYYGDLLQPD